jgi:hypothetical protein
MATNRESNPKGKGPRGPPPALNPESGALVQPYKDFVARGLLRELTVKFTPTGYSVQCSLPDYLREGTETESTQFAVGEAKQRIINKGLWTPGGNSKGTKKPAANANNNPVPKKTLVAEDFLLDDDKLRARALAVAKELGDTTARGRIGSLKMMIDGCDTFESWWTSAAPAEKTRLVAEKKHHDKFSGDEHKRLSSLLGTCPFRGPVPSPSEEDEDEITQGGHPTSQALVPKK